MKTIKIPIPDNFNLYRTINSHGWYELSPFRTNEHLTELSTVITLSTHTNYIISINQVNSSLKIVIENVNHLSSLEIKEIKDNVRLMFRIDESLDEFYSLCKKEPHLRWVPKLSAGRLLRSPRVFEDVVKMLFTTNCNWSLTKIMTRNLVSKLGEPLGGGIFAFPTPERIAAKSEKWLRKEISCGYRAPYLLELCKNLSSGKIELESLRTSELPTEELYQKLRTIKGIGHYAAGNLLKLLGRYDYLGIDSWVRSQFYITHKKGRKVSDTVIEKHYHKYGKWRGLTCWMEATAHWHN